MRESESLQLDDESLHPTNKEPESTNVTAADRFRFNDASDSTATGAVSYKNALFFDCTLVARQPPQPIGLNSTVTRISGIIHAGYVAPTDANQPILRPSETGDDFRHRIDCHGHRRRDRLRNEHTPDVACLLHHSSIVRRLVHRS